MPKADRQEKSIQPCCIVIAGPNGAGKTTFAKTFLQEDVDLPRFINADLIAAGISPLKPELAALSAGRLFLSELDRLAAERVSFAFETTMSGLVHLSRLKKWRADGYWVEIAFLKLDTPSLAVRRVATRVKQGGHAVPREDILRRFHRGWKNFLEHYRFAADAWTVYDNSGLTPVLLESNR
jgi:predicted ABC-type ATPase